MLIMVHADRHIAGESRRQIDEGVEVDINDSIDTVKTKVTLIYTELDPDKFYLELQGYRCLPSETVLQLKRRYQEEPMNFYIRHDLSCCQLI
jgi:hypothetical protein